MIDQTHNKLKEILQRHYRQRTSKCELIDDLSSLLNDRAVLAQEVVKCEPVAWAMKSGLDRCARNPKASHAVYGHDSEDGWDVPLYTSPPPPIPIPALADRSYDAAMVRHLQTVMALFSPTDLKNVRELLDAQSYIDRVKELNQ